MAVQKKEFSKTAAGVLGAAEMADVAETEGPDGTVDAAVGLSLQASLGFTLIGTEFYALYQKDGDKNTFLVMPTKSDNPGSGMSIAKMVEEINKLIKGVTKKENTLDSTAIENSIEDVVNASQEGETKEKAGIEWDSITIYLEQAFLYLETGVSPEYAFSIRIDTSLLFGDNTFFNVSGLTLGFWNTNRKKVLERMSLQDVESALKELQ